MAAAQRLREEVMPRAQEIGEDGRPKLVFIKKKMVWDTVDDLVGQE